MFTKRIPIKRFVSLILTSLMTLCVFAISLLFGKPSRDQQQKPLAGAELLHQAEQLTDIRSGSCPPFRLTARVEVYEEKGRKKEGTYTLLWNSPTIWRDETTFPDSSQIRVAHGDKLLISRNPPKVSEQVLRVVGLMGFSSLLRTSQKEEVHQVQQKSKNGSIERLVEITSAGRSWKKVYLDRSIPVPIQVEYKGAVLGLRYPYKDFDVRFQFEAYSEFHGLQFPRAVDQFESNVLRSRAEVRELVDATFEESNFVPPDDSHWIRWCNHPEPPTLQSPVATNPVLPPQFRTGMPPSRVIVSGIIATDGLWHNLEVIKSGGGTVDSFWMNLMYRQRFTPAQCGQVPVEYETVMEFDYP